MLQRATRWLLLLVASTPGIASTPASVLPTTSAVPGFGFYPANEIPLGPANTAVTGDINLDGHPDLVFVAPSGKELSILLGKGDGFFTTAPSISSPAPRAILIADFNRDGNPDLALLFPEGSLDIFFGNGDGTFLRGPTSAAAPASSKVGTFHLVAADFNRDGFLDLAISGSTINDTSASLNILFGTGDGAFLPPVPYASGQISIDLVTADFNSDGLADVALFSRSGLITIFLNRGDGSLRVSRILKVAETAFSEASGLYTGDLNEDGAPDLVWFNSTGAVSSQILIFPGTNDGDFRPPISFTPPLSVRSLAIADFNGDGHLDLALGGYTSALAASLIHLAYGNGDATLRSAFDSPGGAIPTFFLTADFDGDGRVDLASDNYHFSGWTLGIYLAVRSPSLAVATGFLSAGMSGVPISQTLYAGGGSPPYSGWRVASGTLPPGLTLDPATGLLSGTPLTHQGSPFSFAVTVRDSTGASSVPRPLVLSLVAPVPAIAPYGITPIYHGSASIQSGAWVSIVGTNLTAETATWHGDYPTTLGDVTVTINGQKAYLSYVSPTQINLEVPDIARIGPVPVVVTSSFGTAVGTATLDYYSPSLSLLPGTTQVLGIIPTPDGSGAWDNGTYDLVGPGNLPNFPTRPVHPGETVVLYGTGFEVTAAAVPVASPVPTRRSWSLGLSGAPGYVISSLVIAPGLVEFKLLVPQLPPGRYNLSFSNGQTYWSGSFLNIR